MTTELSKRAQNQLAKPQAFGGGLLQGEEAEDTILPRLHIVQGLPKERELYGKWDEGDLINTLTRERVAESGKYPRFIPVFGWVEYIKFSENGQGIEYRTREKADVPPQDLEWVETAKGRRPGVTKILNWVILLEGDTIPLVLSFKSSSLKAGQQINSFEKIRSATGKRRGMYTIDLKQKSNEKGTWLSPTIRPMGDPPADLLELAEGMYASMNSANISTNLDDDGAADEEMPPI